jgi:hypothetical protein
MAFTNSKNATKRKRRGGKQQQKRRAAELTANRHIGHIEKYLKEEYEFDGGYPEIRREAERLRGPVRDGLVAKLLKNPNMEAAAIRSCIEDLADDYL